MSILKILQNSHKTTLPKSLFNKNFIEINKKLRCGCFPMNFAKTFLIEDLLVTVVKMSKDVLY